MKTLVVRFSLKVLEQHIMKLRLFACLLGLALLLGCGGGGTSPYGKGTPTPTPTPTPPPPSSSVVLVNLGGFAVDQIVSFELTIDSVVLRSSNGDVSLLSTPRRFELSRLSLNFEPVLLRDVAHDNYSALVIGVSNPEISFIDSSGVLHEDVKASLTSSTETIDDSILLNFRSTPTILNLILLADSVDFGGGDAVSVTPRFGLSTVSPREFAAKGGQVKELVGRVTTVMDASSTGRPNFTIDVGNNGTFTFAWDWWDFVTEFQGFGDKPLTAGMTVEVNAVPSGDAANPFYAMKVKLEQDVASELVVEGLALSVAAGQLQTLVREVHGPAGVTLPGVGKVLTVNANASTQFHPEPDGVDLNNLDFTPTFDALTMAPGQNVRSAAAGGSATTITADELKLEKQSFDGIAGAVTAGSVSGQFSFPLNLAADSAFAKLTGHTSVLVTLQPSTEVFIFSLGDGCITCITGQPVRVRGLLFFSGGQYRLVAERLAEK